MSPRWFFGYSDGEVMRSDAKPCSRLMRHTARIFSVGGGLLFGFFADCIMVLETPYPGVCGGFPVERLCAVQLLLF